MGRTSKAKGSSFERLVAKLVLEAFPDMTAKDCYRTPLSGGHPTADAGDLVLSERLRKLFPYSVECKHTKDWSLHQIMPLREGVRKWVQQTVKAAEKNGLYPLLVMRGNNTAIYAMVDAAFWHVNRVTRVDATQHNQRRMVVADAEPSVMFAACEGRLWAVVLLSSFLELRAVKKRSVA